jgi:tetratricopeptide (TPR) repeat protein
VHQVSEEDWQSLLGRASQLRRAGRIDEAIAAYQRLLAIKPDLPDSWYNLGWLQKQARAFDEALESYARALAFGVAKPEEVHLNRAVILSDHLHRPDDAERELRAALEKKPDYVPALLNLGNLHEDLGDRTSARAAYDQAVAADPGNGLALARLAGVSHSPELDAELAERLRRALARPGIAAADEADLAFALAGLLDAAGRHDQAFAAASTANAASRAATGATYDRAAHEQLVDRLIATFDRPAEESGTTVASPIFICGMFRSGSTLVEQILASHARVTAGGELDLIAALLRQIPDYPESVADADAETITRWRSSYLAGLPVQPSADRLVTDKRPDNFLHIGLIKTMFPGARIVHTRRDPLDNLVSLYFLHLDPRMAYALDVEDAAHWYGEYQRLMAHWKALYPDDIFDVDYDELVIEPRAVLEPLLAFLRLDWDERVLEFHRGRAAIKTASVWQVRQPLHARSSGRWRNYESQLAAISGLFAPDRR